MCMVSVNTETMDLSAKHRSTYETLSTMGSALDYPKKVYTVYTSINQVLRCSGLVYTFYTQSEASVVRCSTNMASRKS